MQETWGLRERGELEKGVGNGRREEGRSWREGRWGGVYGWDRKEGK